MERSGLEGMDEEVAAYCFFTFRLLCFLYGSGKIHLFMQKMFRHGDKKRVAQSFKLYCDGKSSMDTAGRVRQRCLFV